MTGGCGMALGDWGVGGLGGGAPREQCKGGGFTAVEGCRSLQLEAGEETET